MKYVLGLLLVLLFFGCATVENGSTSVMLPEEVEEEEGVYHKVQPGETIWRIAQAYDMAIDEIIYANNIPNVARVEENQLIFIPGVTELKEVVIEDDPNKDQFVWPIRGKVLNYFGERKGAFINKGIHIEAQGGQRVQASRQGTVVFADYLNGYDYTVIVDHLDGFYSVYSKNSKLLVKMDDKIYKGDPIAEIGKQGDVAFLHFEIRKGSTAANPLYFLPQL